MDRPAASKTYPGFFFRGHMAAFAGYREFPWMVRNDGHKKITDGGW